MAQQPADLTPLVSAQHFFGAELRHWRCLRGLFLASLGRTVHVTGDLIGKIEKAERWPHEDLVQQCDVALDTDGVLCRLYGLADNERRRLPASHRGRARPRAPLPSRLVVLVLSHGTAHVRPDMFTESAQASVAWSANGPPAGEGPNNVVDLAAVRDRNGVRVTDGGHGGTVA